MKKNFGNVNLSNLVDVASGGLAAAAASGAEAEEERRGKTGQTTADEEEQKERKKDMRTQGRKGCSLTRINMAFTDENHDYIKVMARISGKSMTEFVNWVLEQYRSEHGELYDEAKSIISRM